MKNEKPVLGMIDCPHCGEAKGMAVKADKNDEPFGHCEECAGQLRVGGKPGRVRKFLRLHPHLGAAFRYASVSGAGDSVGVAASVPVTAPSVQAAPVTEKTAPEIPVTVTEQKPPKQEPKKSTWMDALASLATAAQAAQVAA